MSPAFAHPIVRAVIAVVLTVALFFAVGPVDSSEARGGCGNTRAVNMRSDRAPLGAVRAAVTCLINGERSARSLRLRKDLSRAAQRHSKRMYTQRCFSHQCPGEASTYERIRKQGYMQGASSFRIGEVIALNRDRASPRDVVRQWRRSAGHRAQILSRGYKHIGVGMIARGGKAFYTVTLGSRSG